MTRIKSLCAAVSFIAIFTVVGCDKGSNAQVNEAGRLVPSNALAVLAIDSPEQLRQQLLKIGDAIEPDMTNSILKGDLNGQLAPLIETKQPIDMSRPIMLAIGAPADPNANDPYMTLILAIKGATKDNVKIGSEASSQKAQLVFLPNSEYVALTTQPELKASAKAPAIVKDMLPGDITFRLNMKMLDAAIAKTPDNDAADFLKITKDINQVDFATELDFKDTKMIWQVTFDSDDKTKTSNSDALSSLASYLPAGEMMYAAMDLDLMQCLINLDQTWLLDSMAGINDKQLKAATQSLEDAKAVMATMKDGSALSVNIQGDNSKNKQMSMFMVTASDDPKAYFDASMKEWKSEEVLYGIKMSSHEMTTENSDITLNASFEVDASAQEDNNPFAAFYQQLTSFFPGTFNITGVSGHGYIGMAAVMGGDSKSSSALKTIKSGKAGPVPVEFSKAMKADWGHTRMAMTMDLRVLAQQLHRIGASPFNVGNGAPAPVTTRITSKANQYRLTISTNLEADLALYKEVASKRAQATP
ncbi:MAG: hypothetical protein P8J86_06105 [Phycisphaerales bacterium]|nr:hypothetical protein [Phycisphaerales bacterium]